MSIPGTPFREPLIQAYSPPRDQKPVLLFAAAVVVVAIILAVTL
jgi:hypothetical protein